MIKELDALTWDKEVVKSEKPVVVDFWHNQCPWCLKFSSIYDKLSEEYERATFAKLNILANQDNGGIATEYGVMGTPTILVFCEGREIGEVVGFIEKDALKQELDRILDRGNACVKQSSVLQNIQDYFKRIAT